MPHAIKNIYEDWKLYVLNPCDIETKIPWLHIPLAKLHALTTSTCPCCSGTRVLALLILAFILGYSI